MVSPSRRRLISIASFIPSFISLFILSSVCSFFSSHLMLLFIQSFISSFIPSFISIRLYLVVYLVVHSYAILRFATSVLLRIVISSQSCRSFMNHVSFCCLNSVPLRLSNPSDAYHVVCSTLTPLPLFAALFIPRPDPPLVSIRLATVTRFPSS
jgi:hypothetical protein